MGCSRRLVRHALCLLRTPNSSSTYFYGMHRALHTHSTGSSSVVTYASLNPSQTRLWPLIAPHLHPLQQQQQQQQKRFCHNCTPPTPLLAHRRPWRASGGLFKPPAAAAGFTASTPSLAAASDDDGPEGELHAVETAIRANALIFAAKLAVFFVSNSSAMLAEAVHSVVDIANQMLLRVGIMKAQRQPTEMHPYGYARDQFIWPLISAVGIFCCGAGVSFVHGVTGLFEAHRELGDLYWNFVVLGVSGVLESHSLYVAVDTLRRRAAQQGLSLLSYIKTGADPAAVAVMMEDSAAVAGLIIAGGCLALCQITGAVYWDAVGSIAVSALLGVVAITLIQRNRKWLIGKSMPKAQEDQILEHLLNDHVIRTVSNIKSEELGVRQYRFQADIAFDGEELARRALDRCGRVRLFKALDAAIRRHDPHALDALLMQFAAVIVSTTGAEVDRMEREIMRLVPGTRWVDLETDRGKPARLSSAYAAAAATAGTVLQQQPSESAAAAGQPEQHPHPQQAVQQLQQQQQQPPQDRVVRQVRPLDSISDQDHLAELEEYPLGSLGSFASWDDVHENVPEWIETFSPDMARQSQQGRAAAGSSSGASARLMGADSGIVGGNYLSHEQMHAIEAVLVEGAEEVYKPFCNQMLQQLQVSGAAAGSSSSQPQQQLRPPLTPAAATSVVSVGSSGVARASADGLMLSWEMADPMAPDEATQQQLADWAASEPASWAGASSSRQAGPAAAAAAAGGAGSTAAAQVGIGPGASQSFCDVMAQRVEQQQQQQKVAAAPGSRGAGPQLVQDESWGEEHKRRTMQKLFDLEDSVLARDGDKDEYKPFCESMFQSLHPNQPKSRRAAAAAAAAARKQQQQKAQETDAEDVEPEPKQHSG